MCSFSSVLTATRFQQAAFIYLVFCGLIQDTAGVCKVTCSTDFVSSLNCSCSVPGPGYSYSMEAECWDEFDHVNGSCTIKPPLQWCQMEPDNFEQIISTDTNCTARAKNTNGEQVAEPNDLTYLQLYQHIRPQPPSHVQLVENDGNYNISWEMVYTEDKNFYLHTNLMYRVRIRTTEEPLKEPVCFSIKEDTRYFVIPQSFLQKVRGYEADVQATVNPSRFQGYWSEWSPTRKWKIQNDNSKAKEPYLFLLLVSLPCALLIYCGRIQWLKNLHPWRYAPNPADFFKPLYHTYQGDFKKWVAPTFTFNEFDFLEKNMAVQVVNEKQAGGLEALCKGGNQGSSSRDSRGSMGMDGSSGLGLYPHTASRQSVLGESRQGTTHSADHISIDTVTVSGGDSISSGVSLDPYRDSQNRVAFPKCSLGEGSGHVAEDLAEVGGASGGDLAKKSSTGLSASPGSYNMEWQMFPGDNVLERISLDSFCSTEHSEDGYPRVGLDLDTVDSGFLESDCSSPVSSDFGGGKEPMDTAALGGAGNSHTNYVKQWVAYTSESGT
ncbi:hypothetical protein AAFF_G00365520 [Aldrovandia affinis]|uniref:Fibronectin type-III domain-containing protein n=1 Tax=Aldrovandia affinis TaxID=143900 RepID=A0AAD7SH26_9TELE|nr:hypothetical protein AAFF_G00365520 [Aldrovandia affinis]